MGFICILLLHKIIDFIVTMHGERDLFKSGHLQFVHNLKEGLIIADDSLKKIKLINVVARQMLQLPFDEDNKNLDIHCFKQLYEQL